MLKPGWTKRVAVRFVPAPVTATIIALRVAGAVMCHWLAGVTPEPLAHILVVASHAFAILAFMMVFGTAEKAFAIHVYYGFLKLKGIMPWRRAKEDHSLQSTQTEA